MTNTATSFNNVSESNASQIITTGTIEGMSEIALDMTQVDLTKLPRTELQRLQRLLTPKLTKYIPHVPTPKQAAFLLLDCKEAFYGGAAGGGKALALNTPIFTDSGWKTIGTLSLKDKVLAIDGSWTELEYITEIQHGHKCYELEFNTGEKIIADAQHLWVVEKFMHRKYWKSFVMTTEQLLKEDKVKLPRRGMFQGDVPQLPNNRILIRNIREVPSVPVKCIRIKHPSHTFLVGKTLIPTHNSDALLMAGLQNVDIKGYAGIIFRKTYADLVKPGALIDRAREWLSPYIIDGEVKWDDKNKKFDFLDRYGPHKETRSILQFGYLESLNDRFNYQGGEYQFIGFDEVTHIALVCYTYMFSRLRRLKNVQIPLRVRSASNPPEDDEGIWVYNRFVNPKTKRKGVVFIPAGMDDNPYLDKDAYSASLDELDPVSRARLRDGNWEIKRKGNMFKREWFQFVDAPPLYRRRVRFWDMAASNPEEAKRKNKSADPDYTVGFLLSEADGIFYIEDIIRVRKRPAETEQIQKNTAITDGYNTIIREEQEPGSSGISTIDMKARTIFLGYNYAGIRSTGNKTTRALGVSAAAERGQIKVVRGCRNIEEFFDELESFPGGLHDDMVDGFSGAFAELGVLPKETVPYAVDSDEGSYWVDDDNVLSGGYFNSNFFNLY